MKPVDIIRLVVIIVAILFGYNAIASLIELIGSLPGQYSIGDQKISLGIILKVAGFSTTCWILIRNNRKITDFIERQK
jgi:hypothetical protein